MSRKATSASIDVIAVMTDAESFPPASSVRTSSTSLLTLSAARLNDSPTPGTCAGKVYNQAVILAAAEWGGRDGDYKI